MEESKNPNAIGPLGPSSLRNFADTLRSETVGGVLMLSATVIALLWVNSPLAESYTFLRDFEVGPSRPLHLDLSLATWAKDGLLAIFFFVVGLELKREFVAGDLRSPKRAALPMMAAAGGMIAPALIYVGFNVFSPDGALKGWAVPTATDIAFAVAVLAVAGKKLPIALRAFLLTLAVVDDLLAILVIAIFYSTDVRMLWLLAAFAVVALMYTLFRKRINHWWLHIPLGVLTWVFMHESGIHATIAGVLIGFAVPAIVRHADDTIDEDTPSLAERYEHHWRPISAGVAVPVFALFAAGVPLNAATLGDASRDPAALGVAFGLLFGKPIGIFLATYLMVKLTKAELNPALRWMDVLAMSVLAGIGFTVSLLIGELAFGEGTARDDHIRAAVLIGSTSAAVVGGVLLVVRGRRHERLGTDPAETLGN